MFRSLPSTTSRLGRLVRLMLLVSVWQAPIPWIHAHATDDSARLDQRLAYHLEQFHPNLRADGMAEAGWHLHFGLPFELLGEPSEETPSGPKSSHPRVETPLLTTADVSIAAVSGTEAISWIVV